MKKKLIICAGVSGFGLLLIVVGTFLPATLNTIFCLLGLTTLLGGLQAVSMLLKQAIFKNKPKPQDIEITDYKLENKNPLKEEIKQKNNKLHKNFTKDNDLCK